MGLRSRWAKRRGVNAARVDHAILTDVLVYGLWGVAFLLGLLARRRRAWIAAAGIGLGLAFWGAAVLTGSYEDDPEGTAQWLSLVYGVPVFALLWAAAVGAGYVLSRVWGKSRASVG